MKTYLINSDYHERMLYEGFCVGELVAIESNFKFPVNSTLLVYSSSVTVPGVYVICKVVNNSNDLNDKSATNAALVIRKEHCPILDSYLLFDLKINTQHTHEINEDILDKLSIFINPNYEPKERLNSIKEVSAKIGVTPATLLDWYKKYEISCDRDDELLPLFYEDPVSNTKYWHNDSIPKLLNFVSHLSEGIRNTLYVVDDKKY